MINIKVTLEKAPNDTHTFCQIQLDVGDDVIGDQNAWSVASLCSGNISDMILLLTKQQNLSNSTLSFLSNLEPEYLFNLLNSRQWGEPLHCEKWPNELADARIFYALPEAIEIFDGESAYIVKGSADFCHFIWRDYSTKNIKEIPFLFDEYLKKWVLVEITIKDNLSK